MTPVAVGLLCLPLNGPVLRRARAAYRAAPDWWWAKGWSWVCGGPLGRALIGIALGWKALDGEDPRPERALDIGAIWGIGQILGAMTVALAYSALTALARGQLTVDIARARSAARDPDRFAQRTRFYVPITTHRSSSPQSPQSPKDPQGSPAGDIAGVLVTIADAALYDTPATRRWVLRGKRRPWRVLVSEWTPDELAHWPIRPDVLRSVQRQKEVWLAG